MSTATARAASSGGGTNGSDTAPANANAECVGPQSDRAGKVSSCEGCPNRSACSTGAYSNPEAIAAAQAESVRLKASLSNVSHVVLVLSGKGGVGKSTVASQLCHELANRGYAVGLLDVDLCGPSAPRMVLGDAHTGATVQSRGDHAWTPVYARDNLAVMSIQFLLQDGDQAVVWRGPRKNNLIQQFLTQTDWTGDTNGLDYLVVDTPPGTSDEHISTVQYLQRADAVSGAIVVTTPEEVSLSDVRKELSFCRKTRLPVLGVVENMSTYETTLDQLQFTTRDGHDCTSRVLATLAEKCPEVLQCSASSQLFSPSHGGAEPMCKEHGVEFWGRLPLDPALLKACEAGQSYTELNPLAPASIALQKFCDILVKKLPVEMAPPS